MTNFICIFALWFGFSGSVIGCIAPSTIIINSSTINSNIMCINEIWKPVISTGMSYEVSNLGRVKRLKYSLMRSNGRTQTFKDKIIVQTVANNGYLVANINKLTTRIHRVIALTFIPNPLDKPQVNHKNGIRNDNRIENLEWNTNSENKLHGYSIGLTKPTWLGKKSYHHPSSKIVIQSEVNGGFIAEYGSAKDAERKTGFLQGNISTVCRGERNHTGGYKWRYKNDNSRPS